MSITKSISIVAIALAFAAPAHGAVSASQRLERLAAAAYERALDLSPFSETMGKGPGPRQDRVELTFTAAHRDRQRAHHRWILHELEAIPISGLSPTERLTHQLLAYRAQQGLEWLSVPLHQHYIFIQLDGGVATNLIKLTAWQPLRNDSDYRAWFRRLRQYPEYLDGIATVMREGIASGVTIPRPIVERALTQLESLVPDAPDIAKSSLWGAMQRFPESVSTAARRSLEGEYRKLLIDEVFPALRRLASFVRDEYLPKARASDGIAAVPGGDRMYRIAMRVETSSDMTPDEIHALGLKEVARVREQFLEAGKRAGFGGPIRDLRPWLRSRPENYPFRSGDDVIAYLNELHARVVAQLPRLFGRFPKARLEIRLTDPALAASMPAQWHPPSDDGTRPGIFMMPVVNAKTVSTFGLAALLAHEGMPGHGEGADGRVDPGTADADRVEPLLNRCRSREMAADVA